jgi:SAM-dependent methyltransferase
LASNSEAGGERAVPDALSGVEAWYTGSLAEHGIDSKAVGWPDAESQLLRFEKLAYLIDADRPIKPVSVNDLGCGYGAMFTFLDQRPGLELAAYHGYDISAEMLAAARDEVGDPRADFLNTSEISTDADYTFVSGTFNVRSGASEEEWSEYVKGTLLEIAKHSRRGFAFNLLTSYVDWREDILFYADPTEFFRFCRDSISRYVTLLHDYPLYEWTIAVLHPEPDGA